eukprot:3940402-Rhodomonas_salina.3
MSYTLAPHNLILIAAVLPTSLRACYAMSGTHVGYAATRHGTARSFCTTADGKLRYQPTRLLRDVRY